MMRTLRGVRDDNIAAGIAWWFAGGSAAWLLGAILPTWACLLLSAVLGLRAGAHLGRALDAHRAERTGHDDPGWPT